VQLVHQPGWESPLPGQVGPHLRPAPGDNLRQAAGRPLTPLHNLLSLLCPLLSPMLGGGHGDERAALMGQSRHSPREVITGHMPDQVNGSPTPLLPIVVVPLPP